MAIYVDTSSPSRLLSKIKEEIGARRVITWEVDEDGDFIHSPPQWRYKAWLRPMLGAEVLTLKIFPPNNSVITREIYAAYHSHFAEMLLNHFDLMFSNIRVSALPAAGDIVKLP